MENFKKWFKKEPVRRTLRTLFQAFVSAFVTYLTSYIPIDSIEWKRTLMGAVYTASLAAVTAVMNLDRGDVDIDANIA